MNLPLFQVDAFTSRLFGGYRVLISGNAVEYLRTEIQP